MTKFTKITLVRILVLIVLVFIDSLSYTGLSGNPAIQTLRNFYLNAELSKKSSSRFWERYTIQPFQVWAHVYADHFFINTNFV